MFNKLVKMNCHSKNKMLQRLAANLLEKLYCCEINCTEIDESVLFAHHARGCTIIASKICEGTVIFQNVTVGSNMKYNKVTNEWDNIGNPIICKGVVIADGAKILGPVIIGENSLIAAGAVITRNVPSNSIAYGVNLIRCKDVDYDFVFNPNMISPDIIIKANNKMIAEFSKSNNI